ncbi:MAG: hypothetical protein K2X94_01560 [Amoebophilaceae bacterium]|nr:hypothetical protein [Amoebophilaceae bacterium]
MHSKKYFFRVSLSWVFTVLCCAQCDHSSHLSQAKKGYYTDNAYKLPTYTAEEFEPIFVEQSPNKLTHFRKELEKKRAKWLVTGKERAPEELWEDLRADLLNKETTKSECLHRYYHSWGDLLKAPTEANEKRVLEAGKQLKADKDAPEKFKEWARNLYNEPEDFKLTKALLSYQEFFYFITEDPYNIAHLKVKRIHSYLGKWQEDDHLPGIQLWEAITKEQEALLDHSVWFAYPKNQAAIIASLTILARLKDDPYSLTYKELQETLPYGIQKLEAVLDEVDFKDEEKVKLLKTYLSLANIA